MPIKRRGKPDAFNASETIVHLREDRSKDPRYKGMREGPFPHGDYDVAYICGYAGYHSRYTDDLSQVTCQKCLDVCKGAK